MPEIYVESTNFTAGEISPRVWGRDDLAKYANAARRMANYVPLPTGPAVARGCFRRLANTKGDGAAVLLPFAFATNPEQSYMMEFGDGYIRIYRKDPETKAAGMCVELNSVYEAADLDNLWWTQDGDIEVLCDGTHIPQQLERQGPTHADWDVSDISLIAPPWSNDRNRLRYTWYDLLKDQDGQAYNLIASKRYGSTSGYPKNRDEMDNWFYYAFQSGTGNHEEAMTGTNGIDWGEGYESPAYERPGYITRTNYFSWKVEGKLYVEETGRYSFGLNGCDAVDFSLLEADAEYGWYGFHEAMGKDLWDEFSHNKMTDVSAGLASIIVRMMYGNNRAPVCTLAWRKDLGMARSGDGAAFGSIATGTFVEAESETGEDVLTIVTPHYFARDIFEIEVAVNDAAAHQWKWHWRKIGETAWSAWSYSSTVDATANLKANLYAGGYKPAGWNNVWMADIYMSSSGSWNDDDAWQFRVGYDVIPAALFEQSSAEEGSYPKGAEWFEERLWFWGIFPQQVDGSRMGSYWNFTPGPDDDDAIIAAISAGRIDPVQALIASRRLAALTASAEHIFESKEDYLSPSGAKAKPYSYNGAAPVKPIATGNAQLFVERSRRRIRELGYNYDTDSYQALDLTVLADHLFAAGVKKMAFQKAGLALPNGEMADILWALTLEGELRGCVYEKDHQVAAWFRMETGATVDSIETIPGTLGDELWAILQYGDQRIIAVLDPDHRADDLMLIEYDGVNPTTEISEPDWAGRTVVFSYKDGGTGLFECFYDLGIFDEYYPAYAVLDDEGSYTFPGAGVTTDIIVGLFNEPTLKPVPPAAQIGDGSIKNRVKSWVEVWVELLESAGIAVNGDPVADAEETEKTEIRTANPGGWDVDPEIEFQQTTPGKSTIVSWGGRLEVTR